MVLVNITLPFDEKKTKQQLCCSRDAQIDSASRHEVGPLASLSYCAARSPIRRRRRRAVRLSIAGDQAATVQCRAATGIVHRTWRAAELLPVSYCRRRQAPLVSLPTRCAIVAEQFAANSNDKKIWR